MAETILPGLLYRESEFQGGHTATCGPNALAMALSSVTQKDVRTLDVYQKMLSAGLCDQNGASNATGVRDAAVMLGAHVAEFVPYHEPWPEVEWAAFLARHAGRDPVVLNVAVGQALHDEVSGDGENGTNVRYHFIFVAGRNDGQGVSARAGKPLPEGYWCGDGDNYAAGDVLQYYSHADLASAQPCGAIALTMDAQPNPGADYPGALWIPEPSDHYWVGRNGQKADSIIIHGTAGGSSAQNVAAYLQSNDPPTSVHFVVGQDGVVVQQVRVQDAAWGNGVLSAGHDPVWDRQGNPNYRTISIECVKPDTRNQTPLAPAQQAALFKLVAWLCDKYGVPRQPMAADGGITGHFSIDPVDRKDCPGTFDWNALWAFLKPPAPAPFVPQPTGFYDLYTTPDPTVWVCKSTGCKLGGGFRQWYAGLANKADPGANGTTILGLPVSNEQQWNGVTRQDFERASLIYDPKHTLTPWDISCGLLGLQARDAFKQIDALNAQITTLKAEIAKGAASGGPGSTASDPAIATLQARVADLEKQRAAAVAGLKAVLTGLA